MPNAELSVRLFLGSVCMFAFALGVNQAGWRHRFLIISLFALSAISGLGAVFYPSVSAGWPSFTLSLQNIASNAWTWFWLIALLSVSVLTLSIRDRFQTGVTSQPATSQPIMTARDTALTTPAPADEYGSSAIGRALQLMDLCADRTDVEMKQITSDHAGERLELTSTVFDVRSYNDDSATISIDPDPRRPELINARIADKDQAKRATFLRKGDKIKVSGKIADISRRSITLTDCEFTRV